jgi:hypothetical protein
MKKSKTFWGMSVIVLTFVLGLANAPVWAGTLTITDIPQEYNGKFASFSHEMSASKIFASAEDASKIMGKVTGAAIADGKVELLLFKEVPIVGNLTAYTANETVRVKLCIRDTADSFQAKGSKTTGVEPDFILPAVTFKSGVAEVSLKDAFKVGSVTITGIPAVYNDSGANVRFNRPDEKKKNTTHIHDTKGNIKDGNLTVKYYRTEEGNYTPYTGALDITVTMGSPQDTRRTDMMALGLDQVAVPLRLLFRAQAADDNAVLSFDQGAKQ